MISILSFIGIFVLAGSIMAVVMAVRGFKKDQEEVELEFGGELPEKKSLFKRKPKEAPVEQEFNIVSKPEVKTNVDEGRDLGLVESRSRKKGHSKSRSNRKSSKRDGKKV